MRVDTNIWGKLSGKPVPRYHPLVCHMFDSSRVALELWEGFVSEGIRQWFGERFSLAMEATSRWVAFWVSLHDMGKATPAFQRKATGEHPGLVRLLKTKGYSFSGSDSKRSHSLLTRVILEELLAETSAPWGLDRSLARHLAIILSGHHGGFPPAEQSSAISRSVGGDKWDVQRRAIMQLLAQHWGIAELPRPRCVPKEAQAVYMVLAGLVSVSDWVASCDSCFEYAGGEVDIDEYVERLPEKSRSALGSLGWTQPGFPHTRLRFSDMFKFEANPMQKAVMRICQHLSAPSLVMIEAPMGLGKTEAAFYLIHEYLRIFRQRGAYVALPTQTTSNQMHRRFSDFLKKALQPAGADPMLLHSSSMLYKDMNRFEPSNVGEAPSYGLPADAPTVEWFATPKRGLLAPFAVGTIDQSLFGVVQTRHMFVRLFGLADKVVVLDEVHAYDTYTSELLKHLLRWLSKLNCGVVLLSATLPRRNRKELIEAFQGKPAGEIPTRNYPRVCLSDKAETRCVECNSGERKNVYLSRLPGGAQAVASKIKAALSQGGCAAVVCNTVKRSQEMYRYMRSVADNDCQVLLLHSQFPFRQRQQIEAKIVSQFGKDGWRQGRRPAKAVLVSTQIIEQSLDIDFDLMVTDLAPVDLVLQRAGRLHRYASINGRSLIRPANVRRPQIWIACPEVVDGVPDLAVDQLIYERYVLLRSYLSLVASNLTILTIPDDVELLIEQVYDDDSHWPLTGRWQRILEDARREFLNKQRKDVFNAQCKEIPFPDDPNGVLFAFNQQLPDDEDLASSWSLGGLTRKALPSVTLICLHARDDGLFVDPSLTVPVDLRTPPDRDLTRLLLERAVRVTNRRVVGYFRSQQIPRSWRNAPLLRYCHPLVLQDGLAECGGCTVGLDAELGLVIEAKDNKKEPEDDAFV